MRHLFLVTIAAGLASAALAQQQTFLNNGVYEIPPDPGIDAQNFVNANGGVFIVTNGVNQETLEAQPFTTTDTLNYTNRGTMIGNPGFDFEYFPSVPPPPQPGVPFNNLAANFVNQGNGPAGGTIDCTGLSIFPIDNFSEEVQLNPKLVVGATNVVDSGIISMDSAGLVDIRGQNLDLRRGTFSMSGGAGLFNILDWGSGGRGTNTDLFGPWDPANDLTPTTAISADFASSLTGLIGLQMVLTNSTPYFESLNGVINGNTIVWRGIFLQDSSPSNVTKNVYFEGNAAGAGDFHIEWVGTVTDPVSGAVSTNYLYLSDDPAVRRLTNFSFTTTPIVPANPLGDFSLISSTVRLANPANASPSSFVNQWPTNGATNDFAYVDAAPTPAAATNGVFYSVTNVLGRIQLSSSQSLNLANTRISGQNYLRLSAPVDFQGNSNSLISSPFADLNLGVTNGLLTISNLLTPTVPAWQGIPTAPSAVIFDPMGGIQAWSGSFFFTITNAAGATITNDVRILMVNSAVLPAGPAFQQDVQLHTGSDLVISDQLNVYRNFSSDAQVLTITTNGPGAFSLFGVLDLLSPDIFWSGSLSNLQFLTNWGQISAQNQVIFAGNVPGPYSDLNAATPYQAFINHGVITNQGTFIRTAAFENSGVIAAEPAGSVDIAASSGALATNGQFLAPNGYVSISVDSLIASNGVIDAGGGPLTLNINCFISDGYLFGNQFAHFTNAFYPHIVTNGNIWTTGGGISIPSMPVSHTADLLGTTITNIALNNFVSSNVWPATDDGPNPDGFGDNLAVGRMILNAQPNGVLNFIAANGSNAIYIDSIELQGNTTNTDGNGNPLSISIEPGMTVYYAQAIQNGVSVAEKLNGKFGGANTNGGQFFWVQNYAGVYSSTNILYPDNNTYIFNEALAISPDINSGGPDGSQVTNAFLVNANNPFPIPTNVFYPPTVVSGPVACGNDDPSSGGNSTNSGGSSRAILGRLHAPNEAPASLGGGSNSPIVFTAAAGSYNGLFYDTNVVRPSSSGYFSATVTPKGGFSAKLQLGSHTYSYSGTFDSSDTANFTATGKGLSPLSVSLQLVNNDQIVGSVGGGNWIAELQADRAAFTSKNPTASAGKDTLLLAADPDISTTSTGEGFATASISTSGGVQFSATLPDGVKITQKSALSKAGVWPVYSSLYGGNGVFIGWMQCTNQSDIQGSAVWEMPAEAGGLYSDGLTNQMNAAGSRIQGSIAASGHYALILSGAGFGTSTNTVAVFGKKVQSSNSALKLSLNPQTGLFNGSLAIPNSKQKLSFQGALLEKSAIGGGFFLNAEQSGNVYFGPAN